MTYKVLVVDDSKLARMSIARLLDALRPNWVRFEAANATEAIERRNHKAIDVALLDVKMGFSRKGFRRPGAQLWVLEGDDGKYLGHLWLSERDNPRHGTRTLQVTTLGIVREGRGKNYGRLLMHKAEQEAKERGIEVIALEVAGNNRRARDLFKDLGYETIRRTMHKRLRAQ